MSRARLLALLRDHAVLRGEFILSSGQKSDYYIDARAVTLSAEGALLVGEALFDLVKDTSARATAGLTLGADPLVSAVAVVSAQHGHPLDGLIVRKERKGHGAGKVIEGPFREGLEVAILEDTVTTGESALTAARVIREHGGDVAKIVGLIDRSQGGKAAVEAAGYSFQAVFSIDELLG